MKKRSYLAIDAFCGSGGLSYGLHKAGFKVCYAFDNDEKAIESYNRNLGPHGKLKNVYEINLKKEIRKLGFSPNQIKLIAGGPPCQGFSLQRRGNNKDPRNDLVKVFFDMAFDISPSFILMENVLGIKGARGTSLVNYVKEKCKKHKYFFHTGELNAADFGAPQIRKRFFIVAEKIHNEKSYFHFPTSKLIPEDYKTVYDAIADLPSPPNDGSEHVSIPNHRSDVLSLRNKERFKHVPQDGGRNDIPFNLRLKCHKVSTDKIGYRYVYGRLAWNKPSGVITARFDSLTRGRFGHPKETRSISLREGARLQTFPDNFIFEGTKVEVARQIGNAIPPVLSRELGKSILQTLKKLNPEITISKKS